MRAVKITEDCNVQDMLLESVPGSPTKVWLITKREGRLYHLRKVREGQDTLFIQEIADADKVKFREPMEGSVITLQVERHGSMEELRVDVANVQN